MVHPKQPCQNQRVWWTGGHGELFNLLLISVWVGVVSVSPPQPAVLVLDEATSQLDVHTEAAAMAATRRRMTGKTVIMIAHRLCVRHSIPLRLFLFCFDTRDHTQDPPEATPTLVRTDSDPCKLLAHVLRFHV